MSPDVAKCGLSSKITPPLEKHHNNEETTDLLEFLKEYKGEQKQERQELAASPDPGHFSVI